MTMQCTDVDMERKREEGKEKEERGSEWKGTEKWKGKRERKMTDKRNER